MVEALKRKKGFTLLELMIAMGISFLLLLVLYYAYFLSQTFFYMGSDMIQDQMYVRNLFSKIADDLQYVNRLNSLSDTFDDLEFEIFNRRVVTIDNNSNDKTVEGNTIHYYLKNSSSADYMILAKKIHSKAGLILCSLNLGAISEVYEDFRGAEGYYHVSLQNAAEISDYLNMAISLFNLGSVYYKQDLLPKAYRCFTRSLHLSDSIGDREGTAACLSYLGMVYETSGKTAEALYQYTQALKIFEELGQQKNIAGTLTMIGKNMLYNGDKPKAKEYFTKSLEIASEIGAKPEMADNFEYLAMVCSYEGNFALAEKYFGQYSEINLKSRTAPLSMEPKAQRPATQELSDSAKKAQYRLLKIAFMIFATILLFMLFFLASKRVAGTYKQKT